MTYANTHAGIREMYLALAAGPVFTRLKFCYVPGRIGPDLDPSGGVAGLTAVRSGALEDGTILPPGCVP